MSSRLTRTADGIVLAPTALAATGPAAAATAMTCPDHDDQHVIVIIGENHSSTTSSPPPAARRAVDLEPARGHRHREWHAGPEPARPPVTASNTKTYTVTPKITGTYKTLPQPNTTYVATGCDGPPANSPDTRFPATLPDGPYQITKYVPYNDDHSQYTGGCEFNGAFVGDPIHRFYQMWQQTAADHGRLFTWVANTAGDDNGTVPPAPIFQGGLQTGFYNMAQGDAPVLSDLAQHYAISDNYHQAVQGGTGANHIALGTGFAASYQNAAGQAAAPPAGEIENPNPKAGTNNNYIQDGYGSATVANTGANPSAPRRQPGVGAIDAYLRTAPGRARTASRAATTC
jgi:phospholipase C